MKILTFSREFASNKQKSFRICYKKSTYILRENRERERECNEHVTQFIKHIKIALQQGTSAELITSKTENDFLP